ncbi:MAG: hypothetical protein GKC04_04010 [Methanomicrobiales archaeon]|nr:hypothetical protein [Methanomicrobiales archaeon]
MRGFSAPVQAAVACTLLIGMAALAGCLQASPADDIVAGLYAENASEQRQATRELIAIGEPAVPALIGVFASGDAGASQWAATALCEIGAPSVSPLIASLSTDDPAARDWAVVTLVCIGEPSVEPLVVGLSTGNENRRMAIKTALIRIGSPALPYLVPLQGSSDTRLQDDVREILASIALTQQMREQAGATASAAAPAP